MTDFSVWVIFSNLLLATRWTIALSLIAFVAGGVVGLALLFARMSKFRPLAKFVALYIEFFQGTPLLMQLFMLFFGVALFGVEISPWTAASLALTFWTSAFLAEIWRGCVESVPRGQWEAGSSVALSYMEQMRYVILPQAMRIAVPPTVGFSVQVIKGTALASIIGFVELTRAGTMLNNATVRPFLVYSLVGLISASAIPCRSPPNGWKGASMPLVSIRDVRKRFGENEVLKGVSVSVEKGDVVAIIGRSGSGKSTLLRCVNGLETHDSGSIVVDETAVDNARTDMRELRKHVGMVFQQFNLFPHLTAAGNVMLAPRVVNGVSEKEARDLAAAMLAKVGLSEKMDAWPSQLSGGQQQRVAIARALAMNPKVLLCDEITSALDPELVNEVLRVVEKLAAEGMTLILVTHEMRFARDVGTKLVFMHQGMVHEEGPPKELMAAPRTPELRQFIGAIA